ncbi:MAG: iron-containing alcohol dehydrogenase [Caldithrix sp.]|nr:iron-containing alcohol dehydrogenase [Caldithrix sp.]
MTTYYEFYNPVKLLSGEMALEQIGQELQYLQVQQPLLITDPGIRASGLLEKCLRILSLAGCPVDTIYDQTPTDSSLAVVSEIAEQYDREQCDGLIALGGGSVMDTAKGVNILVSEGVSDLLQFAGAHVLKRPLKPLIAVPTTAGTGSEVTAVAVIRDEERRQKLAFVSQFLLPHLAVLDLRTTLKLPPQITAATGMDALTHAVEAFTCLAKNPMSDAYATAAIGLIGNHLTSTVKKSSDKAGRMALANAAAMSGIAFSNSMVGMVHALGHVLGAHCHLPHGQAMSILLPHVLHYNMNKGQKNYEASLSELLVYLKGAEHFAAVSPEQRPAQTIDAIRELKNQLYELCRLPRTLSETGKVKKDQLQDIAREAVYEPSTIYNPVEMDVEDALRILQQAFDDH